MISAVSTFTLLLWISSSKHCVPVRMKGVDLHLESKELKKNSFKYQGLMSEWNFWLSLHCVIIWKQATSRKQSWLDWGRVQSTDNRDMLNVWSSLTILLLRFVSELLGVKQIYVEEHNICGWFEQVARWTSYDGHCVHYLVEELRVSHDGKYRPRSLFIDDLYYLVGVPAACSRKLAHKQIANERTFPMLFWQIAMLKHCNLWK